MQRRTGNPYRGRAPSPRVHRAALPLLSLLAIFTVTGPALALEGAGSASDVTIQSVRRVTDPVVTGVPVEVEAVVDGNVTSVLLAACRWDPVAQNASYCLAPEIMVRGEDGTWRGRFPTDLFPGGSEAGFKLIARNATGAESRYPVATEYDLFTVQHADAETPAPGALPVVALLALLAWAAARGSRRST